jgi:hypothetical protein
MQIVVLNRIDDGTADSQGQAILGHFGGELALTVADGVIALN